MMLSTLKPTEAMLLAEAQRLGTSFRAVRIHLADLLADAAELSMGRRDVNDLAALGFMVTDTMFESIRLLSSMLNSHRHFNAQTQSQLARLLLNLMQHVSREGLAAYVNSPARQMPYELNFVTGRRASLSAQWLSQSAAV